MPAEDVDPEQHHESYILRELCFFFQAEDGIRDLTVTGVQTCALPIWHGLEPHGAPVLAPQAAVGAHDDVLRTLQGRGAPAHAHVLRQAEDVAARLLAQHVGSKGQAARGSGTGEPAGGDGAGRAEHCVQRRGVEFLIHVHNVVAADGGSPATCRGAACCAPTSIRAGNPYRSGTSNASTTVVTILVRPTTASTGVQDLKVSSSVTPPIFENSQKPLSFIHDPTSDPLAIAVAT